MNDSTKPVSYKGLRFPQGIISHAVWLYFRLSLSYRDVICSARNCRQRVE